jgi:hypothetical protein
MGEISERMCEGTPRDTNRLQSASITSVAFNFRATRIASSRNHDWNRTCQFHNDRNDTIADNQNDVRIQFNESGGIGSHHIHVVRGLTLVELDIAVVGPTQPCQFLPSDVNVKFDVVRIALKE